MAFDAFINQDKAKPKKLLRIAMGIAITFHAALGTAAGVHSFWHVEELSGPNVAVTFMSGTPPPPPPPPPPKKKKTTPTKKPVEIVQPKPNAIVQPKEKDEPEEEDEGVEGGVEGGVAGGTLGGVPTEQEAPKMLPPAVGKGMRISDMVNDPKYRPRLPPPLQRAGMSHWGLYKVCVAAAGNVSAVTVMRAADPLVNDTWIALLKTLQHKPYSVNGRPVPYCYPLRVEVAVQ